MSVVVRNIERTDASVASALGGFGVATIHEAQGRIGLLAPQIRPIYPGAHASGTAVTVSVPPGDNWMIHVAVEECRAGDLLIVSPTAPSDAGYFGELLATALQARDVHGLVIEAGCRDIRDLERIGFPVWSRYVSAQGTAKETLGDVNLPIVCAGQDVNPGDVVVADDDGVVVVRRQDAPAVLEASREREAREAEQKPRYAAGELSVDIYDMRPGLAAAGLTYVEQDRIEPGAVD